MSVELVERIANAVLYEGYILYPYRASSVKNQRRFNFGVRDDTTYRFQFSIANIGSFGNLKKQERLF